MPDQKLMMNTNSNYGGGTAGDQDSFLKQLSAALMAQQDAPMGGGYQDTMNSPSRPGGQDMMMPGMQDGGPGGGMTPPSGPAQPPMANNGGGPAPGPSSFADLQAMQPNNNQPFGFGGLGGLFGGI